MAASVRQGLGIESIDMCASNPVPVSGMFQPQRPNFSNPALPVPRFTHGELGLRGLYERFVRLGLPVLIDDVLSENVTWWHEMHERLDIDKEAGEFDGLRCSLHSKALRRQKVG